MDENTNEIHQVIEVSLGWLDIISLFSGVTSLVMGGLAIWLSITFYKMSEVSSKGIEISSNNINNNVEKLEKIFDRMYSDTFGMVKETVSHMREQVDRNTYGIDIGAKLDDKINKSILESLKEVSTENLSKGDIKDLVLNLLKESKDIELEVKKSSIEEEIIKVLKKYGPLKFNDLEKRILDAYNTQNMSSVFFDTLLKMAQGGIIENHFDEDSEGVSISTSSFITLI